MKDCFDAIHDIISLINADEVKNIADIYSWFAPGGSYNKPRIVIKALFLTNDYIQSGIFPINIHVPEIESGGKKVTDQATFNKIEKLIVPLIQTQHRLDFWTEVEQVGRFLRDTDGTLFIPIRVRYRSINSDYKGI